MPLRGTVTENNLSIISKDYDFAWFPCSSVGTHMVCIPTQEHGNEKIEKSTSYIKFGQTSYLKVKNAPSPLMGEGWGEGKYDGKSDFLRVHQL